MRKVLLSLAAGVALAVLAGASLLAADIIVAPNPWVPADVRPERGNYTNGIKFYNMPLEGELRIYTVSGIMVRRIEFQGQTTPLQWSGKNENGEYVASGVYLWVVRSGDMTKTGKVVVIR